MEIATTGQTLDNAATLNQPVHSFRLKGSLFTLTILQLLNVEPKLLTAQLKRMAEQTPKFFQHTPVVLDLKLLPDEAEIIFAPLLQALREFSLIPIGIRSGTTVQQQAAVGVGLAVLPEGKDTPLQSNKTNVKTKASAPSTTNNKLITSKVRSGQQVYAPHGDLVVIGSVSTGAELLADGNIHVYGPLRGRALAGINGDTKARIFCQSLECELVSIAGHYMLIEEQKAPPPNKSMQVHLTGKDTLTIESL